MKELKSFNLFDTGGGSLYNTLANGHFLKGSKMKQNYTIPNAIAEIHNRVNGQEVMIWADEVQQYVSIHVTKFLNLLNDMKGIEMKITISVYNSIIFVG